MWWGTKHVYTYSLSKLDWLSETWVMSFPHKLFEPLYSDDAVGCDSIELSFDCWWPSADCETALGATEALTDGSTVSSSVHFWRITPAGAEVSITAAELIHPMVGDSCDTAQGSSVIGLASIRLCSLEESGFCCMFSEAGSDRVSFSVGWLNTSLVSFSLKHSGNGTTTNSSESELHKLSKSGVSPGSRRIRFAIKK